MHLMTITGSSADSQDSSAQPPAPYVLVVDDDPDARDILRTIMEMEGFAVKEAEDGQAALDLILKQKPGVILMDLMMPGMDGFTLLNRLQATLNLRHIPVIVISAMSIEESTWYHLPGVEDILEKGRYKIEDLQEKVRTLLAR